MFQFRQRLAFNCTIIPILSSVLCNVQLTIDVQINEEDETTVPNASISDNDERNTSTEPECNMVRLSFNNKLQKK